MTLLQSLDLDELTPSRLWTRLEPDLRTAAAQSYFRRAGDRTQRREGELAIARALRFREEAVRRLPVEKRAGYLARAVRPDDSLASALLLALHVEQRAPLLATFLDHLGIPHEGGMISEDHELAAPPPEKLREAVDALYAQHDAAEVELYLSSLLAMDSHTWGGLAGMLRERVSA